MTQELTLENLYYKVITNDLLDLSILSEEKSFGLIKLFEQKHDYDYGYKSKNVIEIYDRLNCICNNNVFNNYINSLLLKPNNAILLISHGINNFTKHLLISDFLCYYDDLFEKIMKNNKTIDGWLKYSSFKLVSKILKYKKMFYKIKDGDKNLNYNITNLVLNCLMNNDDRVNKLVLKYINKENISTVFKILSEKPSKYFLKYIKQLNKYINLKLYFDQFLYINYNDFDTFVKIIKIYQNNVKIDFNRLGFIGIFFDSSSTNYAKYKYLEEICSPQLFKIIQRYMLEKTSRIKYKDDDRKVLIELIEFNNFNLKKILENCQFLLDDNNHNYSLVEIIVKKYGKEVYNQVKKLDYLYFFVRYGNYFSFIENEYKKSCYNTLYQINLVKSFLRMKIRKYLKNKETSLKNNFKRLLNDINTYIPNDNIPVLSSGSYKYQIIKQSFHNILPPEMFNIKNKYNNSYLSLKADGINATRLPSRINIKLNALVKAEYLELDGKELYLVYDINLPNLTYIERINYLRKLHPYKLNTDYKANNLNELINIIKEESILEKKWMDENKTYSAVWYPKAFIKYTGNLNDLAIQVLNNEFNPPYLNYPIDGLILNNNGIDYKIKPKNQHTIDILYLNNKWLSTRNRKIKYNIINPYDIKLNDDTIYRCYPEDDNTYVIKDERYDKMVPNSLEIIENIRESYFQLDKNSYYQKEVKIDNINIKIIKNNRNHEKIFLRSLDLDKSKNILDLCGGKGQVINMLPNHKYYNLIDLAPKFKYNNKNVNIIKNDLRNMDLGKFKDDIWICVNGLWYWKDNFIKNLIKYNPNEIIFNVHKRDVNWSNNKSYIKLEDGKVKYYYDWCHKKECVENHVTIDHLIRSLEINGYICKKMLSTNENNLISQFEFYYFRRL